MDISKNKLSDGTLEGLLCELSDDPIFNPLTGKEIESLDSIEKAMRQAFIQEILPKPSKLKYFLVIFAIFLSFLIGVGVGWIGGFSTASKQRVTLSSPNPFPEEEIIEPLPELDEEKVLAPTEIA